MKKIFKVVFVFIATSLILEGALFVLGFNPNQIYNDEIDDISYVDQETNIYTTDEAGIYKINTPLVYLDHSSVSHIEAVDDIISEGAKQLVFLQGASPLSDTLPKLTQYIALGGSKDSVLLKYLKYPINEEGFRSIPFETFPNSSKKRILLIGDSFAWGLSANPIFKSFADNLLAENYLVYNTGISGTDPAQYAAIAKKYIPILKPDLVILNFYYGNDFMSYNREVGAGKPHEHYTSAGFLDACPYGEYIEATEILDFYKNLVTIPPTGFFNKFCAKTRVGTHLVWRLAFGLDLVEHATLKKYLSAQNMGVLDRAAITKKYIQVVNTVAEENNIPCLNVICPEVPFHIFSDKEVVLSSNKKKVLDVAFEDLNYYFPEKILVRDFKLGGSHFNNIGMEKYSTFLKERIEIALKH